MEKLIVNKHLDTLKGVQKIESLFSKDNELSKGEIIVVNDAPGLLIKNNDGEVNMIPSINSEFITASAELSTTPGEVSAESSFNPETNSFNIHFSIPKGEKGDQGSNGLTPEITADGFWKIGENKTEVKAKGENGADGVTPKLRIEKGLWEVSYDGGSKWEATNVKATGENGADGLTPEITEDNYWKIGENITAVKAKGENGADGLTPEITENGLWKIGEKITNVKAKGEDGKTPKITIGVDGKWYVDGVSTGVKATGENGVDGKTPIINGDGIWQIGNEITNVKAKGEDGKTPTIGIKLDSDGVYYWTVDGNFILDESHNKIKAVGIDGSTPEIGVVSESDGNTYWTVNGKPITNESGDKVRANGNDGKDGKTPTIGAKSDTDGIIYWTVNNDFMIDEKGQKVKAVGTDGNSPEITEQGFWKIGEKITTVKAKGENGKDGASAYEVAGGDQKWQNEENWLNSLKGQDGKDGSGVNILGSYETEEELNSAHPTGKAGEAYLIKGNLYVWPADNSGWLNVGNIQGPKGNDGAPGKNGTSITVKESENECKVLGDSYIDPVTGEFKSLISTEPKTFSNGGKVKGEDGITPIISKDVSVIERTPEEGPTASFEPVPAAENTYRLSLGIPRGKQGFSITRVSGNDQEIKSGNKYDIYTNENGETFIGSFYAPKGEDGKDKLVSSLKVSNVEPDKFVSAISKEENSDTLSVTYSDIPDLSSSYLSLNGGTMAGAIDASAAGIKFGQDANNSDLLIKRWQNASGILVKGLFGVSSTKKENPSGIIFSEPETETMAGALTFDGSNNYRFMSDSNDLNLLVNEKRVTLDGECLPISGGTITGTVTLSSKTLPGARIIMESLQGTEGQLIISNVLSDEVEFSTNNKNINISPSINASLLLKKEGRALFKCINGVESTNGFFDSSDERLKDFGNDISVNFDALKNIPKKYFTWKDKSNNSDRQIGTSAQEVQKLYPELVKEDENGTLSVSYEKLSIVALKAVDELHDENERLKARLEAIEKKLGL